MDSQVDGGTPLPLKASTHTEMLFNTPELKDGRPSGI